MANNETKVIISAQDKTRAAITTVKNNLQSLTKTSLLAGTSLAGIGSAISVAGFAAFVKSGIDTLDMLGDLSVRTGVAASTLAGFQLVAKESDTSLESLGKGLNKLTVYMANNADEAARLGLSAKDPAEAFIQLSATLSNLEDVQLRNAVAQQVLGKSYEELLPALVQGEDELRKQIDAGKAYTNATPEAVQAAQDFNGKLDVLSFRVSTLSAALVSRSGLVDSLLRVADAMDQGVERGGVFRGILDGIIRAGAESNNALTRAIPVVGPMFGVAGMVAPEENQQTQSGKIKKSNAGAVAKAEAAARDLLNKEEIEKKKREAEAAAKALASQAKRNAEALARAQFEFEKSQRENSARLTDAQIDANIAGAKREYEAKTLSAEEYYSRIQVLEAQKTANEIALLEKNKAAQERIINGKADAADKVKAKAEIDDINTQISIAQTKLATFKAEASADLIKAQAEKAKTDIEAIATQIDAAFENLRNQELKISSQVELGLPQVAAEQQINEVRRETVAIVTELLAKMEALASANQGALGADASRQITQIKRELEQTSVVLDTTAARMNAALETGMGSFLRDTLSGTKSVEAAFADMFASIAQEATNLISRNLSQQLMQSLFGGSSGSNTGGFGGILSGIIGGMGGGQYDGGGGFFAGIMNFMNGYAEGGYTGSGSKYQPKGIVHGGEFVFSKAATSKLGVNALAHLHNLASGAALPQRPRYGYADGGAVNLPTQGGAASTQPLTIINAIDKDDVQNAAFGNGSDKKILNIVSANKQSFRAALGV